MNAAHAFSAFTPLAGGTMDTYNYGTEYPYDLDGSLDFTRPATGRSIFPFPVGIGHVMGVAPLYDELARTYVTDSNIGINGTVFTNVTDLNQMNRSVVFPDIMGGLQKVKG